MTRLPFQSPSIRWLGRSLLCAGLFAALALPAFAQGNSDPNDEEVPNANAQQQQEVNFAISDDNFDQWVYGGAGQHAGRPRLSAMLQIEIDAVDRICKLSAPQKEKLTLAGRSDIKAFLEEVAEIRKKFDALKRDQNAINQIFQELQPLRNRLSAGIFGADSMYRRVLPGTLNEEQRQKLQVEDRSRQGAQHRALVELTVAILDRSLAFRDEQRKKLVALLLKETRPPNKPGQYGVQVILLQASKLPEDRLKPLLDDKQWRALAPQLRNAKGLEQFLRENNMAPQEPVEEKRSGAASKVEK